MQRKDRLSFYVSIIAGVILGLGGFWGQVYGANDSVWVPLHWGDDPIDSVRLMTKLDHVRDSVSHTTGTFWDTTIVFAKNSRLEILYLIYFQNRTGAKSYHYSNQLAYTDSVVLADGSLTAAKIATDAIGADELAGSAAAEIEDSIYAQRDDYKSNVATMATNIAELLADLDTLAIISGYFKGARSITSFTNDSDVVQMFNGASPIAKMVFYHLDDTTGGAPDSTVTGTP